MQNILQKTEFSLRACILGNAMVFALALTFRAFITGKAGYLAEYAAHIIHGSVADLTFPLIVTALAAYLSRQFFFRLAFYACHVSVLVIAADFFHFIKFGDRLNRDLLSDNSLLNWLRHDRITFLAILLAGWLSFALIKQASSGNQDKKPNRRQVSMLLLCSMVLLFVQIPALTPANVISTKTWEDFYESYSFAKKANLQKSSFNCLFKLYIFDQEVARTQLFESSMFFHKEHKDFELSAKTAAATLENFKQPELWLHMGYHNQEIAPNSLEALSKAIESGYSGIELDIHFLEKEDRLVVCHDLPTDAKARQDLPDLAGYLQLIATETSQKINVWLDFKNLNYSNQHAAINRLKDLSEQFKVMNSLLVESRNPFILRNLSKSGFKTIWGLYYGASQARISVEHLAQIKAYASLSGCKVISLPWQAADELARQLLSPMPLAVYTVNEPGEIKRFLAASQPLVILTDLNNFMQK